MAWQSVSKFITFSVLVLLLGACAGGSDGSSGNAEPAPDQDQTNAEPLADQVTISGSPFVGSTLTGTYAYSDDDGDLEGATSFRWLRNTQPISGATDASYLLVREDADSNISFEVTPIASTGETSGDAKSTSVYIQNSKPIASDLFVTGSSSFVGTTWYANYTYEDVDGDLVDFSVYQWLRDGVVISGATSASYTLTATDSGKLISFDVYVLAITGSITGTTVTSPAYRVENSAPTASDLTMVSNSASALLGVTITAQYIYSDLDLDIEAGSLIRWFRDDVLIDGANDHTYLLSAVDSEHLIHFSVTPIAEAGVTTGSQVYSTSFQAVPVEYAGTGQSLGGGDSKGVALGDLDGDGDLDMAVVNDFSGGNKIYLNDGASTFSEPLQSIGTDNSEAVALGDMDGDGDLDMVVANDNFYKSKIYLNDGSAIFTGSGQEIETSSSVDVVLGDLDGDGDLDVIFVKHFGGNDIYMNDGSGVLGDAVQSIGDDKEGDTIALGDVDGDGDLDMIVGNVNFSSTDETRLYLNDGNGVFSTSSVSLGLNVNSHIELGDLDGDGDLDMIIANLSRYVSSPNRVYINDGSGVFSILEQSLDDFESTSLALGDVDLDGDLDCITDDSIYINDGSGTFTKLNFPFRNSSKTSVITLGDVDGDGDLDIVVAVDGGGNEVYINRL
ncbi:hypothetical protein A9Q81_01270 [Gammaproteobacteria bacterium 42_54_T18]|nr:hypothetical protein A9Q81_01270 [Gammaproteobacteria bacterium 42_54_T18]